MDKLTIVAHDRFQEIIEAANRPDSIIRKENIITIDVGELGQPKEVVVSVSRTEEQFADEQEKILTVYVQAKSEKIFSFGVTHYLRCLRQAFFHKSECLLPLGQAQ